jgi:RNA polymerase sigma factor (sigma-70 family)
VDTKNYNQCVDLYSDRVYRYILKSTKDADQAKDIVQDAFVRLWESHTEVMFEKSKSWLFTTAYRIMIDGIRKNSKISRMESHHPEPQHTRHWSDLQEVLHQALGELPEIQRQLVLLRDYEGYSYEEIGEITHLNPSQVKVYIFRARKRLKDHLVSMDLHI